MTFLNVSLLGGMALIAVPILLHLLLRRRPRRVEFPAIQFVRQRQLPQKRRLRIRHWLLLALRVAVIGLLSLAMARPSVIFSGDWALTEEPVAAALIFDTSVRMEYRHENRTRLEAAKELALWLLAELPQQSDIAVLSSRSGPVAFEVDRASARQRIGRLESSADSLPLPTVISRALELLQQNEKRIREIYIFTDLARVAWPTSALAQLASQLQNSVGLSVYLVDVGVPEPKDFALSGLQLPRQILSSRGTLVVQTQLEGIGIGGPCTVQLELLEVDPSTGRRSWQKREEKLCQVQAGQAQQVVFRLRGLSAGLHQGQVRIVGGDALPANDVRYFTFEVKTPWQLLLVAPDSSHLVPGFVSEALAPREYRLTGQARYDCRLIRQEELSGVDLSQYAAVILLDPKPLEELLWQKLAGYVADGHGLAICLGRNAQPMDSFLTPAAQSLLPGPLQMQVRRPDFDTYLAPSDRQHPILAEFRRLAGTVPWDDFPVLCYWQLGELAKGVNVIVSYSDGRPALLERPVGKGRVLTLTTPLTDDTNQEPWNLLPVGDAWPYLILVNELAAYLVGAAEHQLNYTVGQTVVLKLPFSGGRRSYVVTAPDGTTFTAQTEGPSNQLLLSPPTLPGNYRVQAGGSPDSGFSINLGPEQTRLERLRPEELNQLLEANNVRLARNRQEINRHVSLGRVGQELFPLLIALVACLWGAELLVANRFYKD
ncbi:MAG: BatA domain-containing protein [Thermoguttaceae bacterium]|nr:BatA domain-containing protein [Thermoguttaceae bacterium]MDW8039090.1 BatA domain-containing protein [Thermoguttaceae bacterium]